MARPSVPTNASSTESVGVHPSPWSHTSEAGKTIYVIVCTNRYDSTNIYNETCTFGGIQMTPWMDWTGVAAAGNAAYVFSLVNPAIVGTELIEFITTAPTGFNYATCAFNVQDGPSDGCIILPGATYEDFFSPTSLARKAYAWDPNGRQIAAVFFTDPPGVSSSLTGGASFFTGPRIIVNHLAAADDEPTFTAARSAGGPMTLLSFLIPEGSTALTGGGFQPIFTGRMTLSGLTPGDTACSGFPYVGINALPERLGDVAIVNGTLQSIAVKLSQPLTGSQQVTLKILPGGAVGAGGLFAQETGFTLTLTSADVTGSANLDMGLAVYKYQRIRVEYENTGGVNLPTPLFAVATMLLETGEERVHVFGGGHQELGSNTVDVGFQRAILHPTGQWATGIPTPGKSLVGLPMTITEMVVQYQIAMTFDPNVEYFLVVNDIIQDGTGGTVDTTTTLVVDTFSNAFGRRQFELAVVPGDFVDIVGFKRNAGIVSLVRHAATTRARLDAGSAGRFMVSGYMQNAGASSARLVSGNDSGASASESEFQHTIPSLSTTPAGALEISVMYAALGAAPGGGNSQTFQLRKNAASTALDALVVSDPDTTGVVSGDGVEYVEGDALGLFQVPVGASTYNYWVIVGSFPEPEPEPEPEVADEAEAHPRIMFRYSTDGGVTWSSEMWINQGDVGEYLTRAGINRLGDGKKWVLEVATSDPITHAWGSASVNIEPSEH